MSPGVLWGYRFADKRQLDVSQERACARSCGTKGLILGAKLDLEERGILEAEAEDSPRGSGLHSVSLLDMRC